MSDDSQFAGDSFPKDSHGASDSEFSLDGIPENFGEAAQQSDDPSRFPQIAGFNILRLIGQGGMGAVYEAKHLDSENRVAIKTIFLERYQTLPRRAFSRFEREIELLQKVSHPNVVPVISHGTYTDEFQQVPYYVMPLVVGGDFGSWMQANPDLRRKDLKLIVERLLSLIDGLNSTHELGIVHRDIKPKNIFVDADQRLVLGDFGLAKLLDEDSELTSTIGHMGTTPYAPPEQLISAKLADRRADVFSLGVILYQLASRNLRPFEPAKDSELSSSETDSIARWQRSSHRVPPKPSQRARHISDPSFDFIVQKCLTYYPEFRYQTAGDLSNDLRAWLRGETVRGSLIEQFRNRIIGPLQPYWKKLAAAGIAIFLVVTSITFYQLFTMNNRVSDLKEDLASSHSSKQSLEQQRLQELRVELASIILELKGETHEYKIRRMPNPEAEFSRRRKRAQEIAMQLDLKSSDNLEDRHSYWALQRTSVDPSLSEEYVRHLQSLCRSTFETLALISPDKDHEQRITAVSDALRSQRMMLELLWYVQENDQQSKLEPFCSPQQLMTDCVLALKEMRTMDWVVKDSATRKHLDLQWLEVAINDELKSENDVVQLCQENLEEISAQSLNQAECKTVHPWYVAWYIFEVHYETARRLNRSPKDLETIVNRWLELQLQLPLEAKQTNITYIIDLLTVGDRYADVLRDSGRSAEALKHYEEDWQRLLPLLAFYQDSRGAWDTAEQIISSMLKPARQQDDTESLLEFYLRENKLLRDKLTVVTAHPTWFKQSEPVTLRFDLARSLYDTTQLTQDENPELLREAESLLIKNLQEDSEHLASNKLLKAIRQEMKANASF